MTEKFIWDWVAARRRRRVTQEQSQRLAGNAPRKVVRCALIFSQGYTTLYRFLQRLDDPTIDRVLGEAARRFKSPERRARRRARVAVDGTGLSHNAASTFFIRRIEQRPRGMTRWSYWLKWLIVTDLDKLIILAQRGRQAPWCDCRSLPDLVDAASGVSPIGLVLADAEFDTEQNHRHIRERLGARSIIPATRGRSSRVGIRGKMRRRFPQKTYRQRAKVETVFSIIKRKLSARAPGRSLSMQKRQASLLGLTYNLYRLRHRFLREDVNKAIENFKFEMKATRASAATAEFLPTFLARLPFVPQGKKSCPDVFFCAMRLMGNVVPSIAFGHGPPAAVFDMPCPY